MVYECRFEDSRLGVAPGAPASHGAGLAWSTSSFVRCLFPNNGGSPSLNHGGQLEFVQCQIETGAAGTSWREGTVAGFEGRTISGAGVLMGDTVAFINPVGINANHCRWRVAHFFNCNIAAPLGVSGNVQTLIVVAASA